MPYTKGFSMQIRVYYEDTDTGGVVYHSNYLNFCERARSEYFFKEGITPALENSHFVAASLEAKYIKPAKLGDTLHVETQKVQMKTASFTLLQSIYLKDMKIFEMTIKLAYIGYDGRPKAMESETKALLEKLFK